MSWQDNLIDFFSFAVAWWQFLKLELLVRKHALDDMING